MKIVHIALGGPVTDNWTYQDNLLPKYHKKMGYDVVMVTSKFIYNSKGEIEVDSRNIYINENQIKTIRLKTYNNRSMNFRFKRYVNLYETLEKEKPDILFIHGVQFLDIKTIVRYLEEYKETLVYVDNHADFSNSAKNWLSKNILHKIVWRYTAKSIEPFVTKFFGVLPSRVDFLKDMYNISEEKIELLIMGADDEKVIEAKNESLIKELREEYGIKSDDFLIMTGGKIDEAKKQTLLLMEAVGEIERKDVKLIVFGSVVEKLKEDVKLLSDGKKVQYVGWIDSKDCYKYFAAADLVVFPGRHSVFWEQVVALGIPLIVREWPGTKHVDIGGNCIFLKEDSKEEIYNVISELVNKNNKYIEMKRAASSKKRKDFLYSNIAKKSISYSKVK